MWMNFLLGDCCTQAMFANDSFCSVCGSQKHEHQNDLEKADKSSRHPSGRDESARGKRDQLRSMVELSTMPLNRMALAARCPARRTVFKLLGIYLPEPQARRVLAEIHNFKWLQAEKAGTDIWLEKAPHNPLAAAAAEWARRHWGDFVRWLGTPDVEPKYA